MVAVAMAMYFDRFQCQAHQPRGVRNRLHVFCQLHASHIWSCRFFSAEQPVLCGIDPCRQIAASSTIWVIRKHNSAMRVFDVLLCCCLPQPENLRRFASCHVW